MKMYLNRFFWTVKMMNLKEFQTALPILEHLEKHGYQAYFVGGSVRDALIQRRVGDIDITTSAKPEEVQEIFEKVIPVGIEHGTVIVRSEGESFEVTTFRTEKGYSDFRRPDQVTFVSNIKQDLQRRDFTINAIAMDKHGHIMDPFGGKLDLEKGIIKAVGEPLERFEEDPLRMMRAVRFVSQLDFNLDPKTEAAIQQVSFLLKNISVERIVMEIKKLFAGSSPVKGLHFLVKTHLHHSVPIWKNEPMLIDKAKKMTIPFYSMEEIIAFFILLNSNADLITWVKGWKLSNQVKINAEHLLAGFRIYKEAGLSNWLVYKLPFQLRDGLARLIYAMDKEEVDKKRWNEIFESLPIRDRAGLAVKGSDIIEIFPEKPKGEWIKRWIETIEYQVVTEKLPNDKKVIKEWVRDGEHPQTVN